MSTVSARRVVAHGIVDIVERYHVAVSAFDLEAVESFFTETAVCVSDTAGCFDGRDAIVEGFRAHFAEFRDRTVRDLVVEQVSDRAVRSVFTYTATSSKTGRKVTRTGEETAFLDRDGFIEKVIARDRTPANAA